MKLLKNTLLLLALMAGYTATAQQDVMISQYLFNGLLINPAYAGSHPYTSSSVLHRSQWAQFDGAPTTSVLAVDGAMRNGSFGMGLLVFHDQLGITEQTEAALNFAYRFRLGAGHMALGLRGGISSTLADLNGVSIWDPGDPVYQGGTQVYQTVKFGAGAYYHLQRMYIGVSVPTLLPLGPFAETMVPHYLATAGGMVRISNGVELKPSMLLKMVNNTPAQLDINLHALFQEKIWLGAGWRTGDAIVSMLEYQVTPELRIGYAHDFTISEIGNYSNGSNELLIGFDFGQGALAKRSPRYF